MSAADDAQVLKQMAYDDALKSPTLETPGAGPALAGTPEASLTPQQLESRREDAAALRRANRAAQAGDSPSGSNSKGLSKTVGYDAVGTESGNKSNPNSGVTQISEADKIMLAKANIAISSADKSLEEGRDILAKGEAAYIAKYGESPYAPPETTKKTEGQNRILVYPEDLGVNPELQNYMQFEMYETGGASLSSQTSSQSDKIIPNINFGNFSYDIEKLRTNINNNGAVTRAAAAAVGGGIAAAASFATGSGLMGSAVSLGVGAFNTDAVIQSGAFSTMAKSVWENYGEPTANTGMGDFSFVAETTGMTTANKRISETILLYLPNNLKTSYGVEYTEDDFGALVETLGGLKGMGRTLANMVGASSQGENSGALMRAMQETYARRALAKASTALGKTIGVDDLKLDKVYAATSRKVQNPFALNLFKSVKRRVFEFSFRFTPRSRHETWEVHRIIRDFRKYALPKRSEDLAGRYLDYPAEFKIKFFHNGVENVFLPKIARCALKDISLTYGDEQFTTFAPEPGLGASPTKIDMSLTFEELEFLTQERIDQGY